MTDILRIFALSTALVLSAFADKADADVPRGGIDNPAKVGSATIRRLGIALYDAEFYTSNGSPFRWQAPMALHLTYRRGFSAEQLTWATMEEITRIEGPNPMHEKLEAELARCYSDVRKGDQITASSDGPNQLTLWKNGRRACTLDSAGIQKRFFGIWLSPQSRVARLGDQLTGK